MKRLLVLALLTIPFLKANDRAQGWCEAGNQTISVMGYQSSTTTPVQRSYPGPAAQVYVYLTGTGSPGTLATIYQDNLGTALANPFSASNLGYWFFYAANGRYDVSCVGAGIPSGRITYGDNVLFDQAISFAAGSGISVSTISGLTTIALDLSVSLPIVNTSGTLSCPTCMTLDTAQTVTGVKTFDAPIFIGANQITDTNAFSAWGGASLNDSTALGYVVSNIDHTWLNQDNESRGVSAVVRFSRSTIDEQTYGWDQFGVDCVVVAGPMTMPADPIYGSPYIRGQQKPCVSELYYQASSSPYTANVGMNYMASLAQVGAGVTVNTWAGFIVGQPGGYGGGGGHVVTGYGVWIQNLLDSNSILTSANAAAIKIDGLGNFGRILWQGAEAYSPVYGTLEFSASTQVQTATGVGFKVGGSAANAGMAAGSYAVGGATLINADHSISTDAYINTSNAFEISGVTVIDPGRNGSFVALSASGIMTIDVTGTTQCLHVNSLGVVSGTGADCGSGGGGGGGSSFPGSVTANTSLTDMAGFYVGSTGVIQYDSGSATISIGNIYNLSATGDIVTSGTHHVGAGNGTPGGYYLGTSQIITGAGVASLLSLKLTGTSTTGVVAQCLHVDTSGNITGTGADCGSGGGGPSFTGSVTANTGGTSGAGFFVDTTGIIQCDSTSCTTISIGNVYNVTATGDVITSGAHHVGSGTDATNGGYWLGTTQIIAGTGQITTNITGSVQCLHVNALGVISGTSADCGSGGGGGTPGGSSGQIQYNNAGVFGGFTAGGDLTFSQPSFTLNTVNSSPVSCGSSTQSCVLTINGKGLVTASSTATISGGSGGNPFTGSVTANTSLTNMAGFYMNTTGVIQYDSGSATISIGNIYNLSASGDITTSGVHHVGSGTGGYYVGVTQVIDGSDNGYFGTVSGSSGTFTASVTANYTPTNTAGYYIQFPASNGAGYTGTTGIIQYATGSPAVVNIGHVYNITADGDILVSGVHHVQSGNGSPGGYYIGTTQVIDGSRNGTFVNLTASGTLSGLVGTVYGSGGISSSGGSAPTISCPNCVLLGGLQINSSGAFIGAGVSTPSYGVNAGSFAISGTTIIDASKNVSTTGYLNGSSVYIGSVSTINSSGQWIGAAISDTYISSAATWNGKVSSVGASGPISSSGGATPTISCSTCITTSGGTMTGSLTVYGLRLYGGGILITTAGAFIGAGVDVGSYGVSSGGYAINDEYYGVTGAGVCTRYIGGICTSF